MLHSAQRLLKVRKLPSFFLPNKQWMEVENLCLPQIMFISGKLNASWRLFDVGEPGMKWWPDSVPTTPLCSLWPSPSSWLSWLIILATVAVTDALNSLPSLLPIRWPLPSPASKSSNSIEFSPLWDCSTSFQVANLTLYVPASSPHC